MNYYDRILMGMFALLFIGFGSVITGVSSGEIVGIAATVASILMGHGLFIRPPGQVNRIK